MRQAASAAAAVASVAGRRFVLKTLGGNRGRAARGTRDSWALACFQHFLIDIYIYPVYSV